jgi:hypothetical protein
MGTVKSSLINPDQYQFVEVSREYTSGDGTGLVVVYKYRGSKDALRAATLAWVLAGGKYQITENGPYSEATVTYSGTAVPVDYALQAGAATTPAPITEQNLTDETPSFRYEFRTEYIDASLFDLAKVRAEAKKFVETFGTGATEGDYYGAIKFAGEDPKNNKLTFSESLFPIAAELVVKFARGQTSFQTSRVSLTRISNYSGLNGLPKSPSFIPVIYTGLFLSNLNKFPSYVRLMMPKPPADPNLTPKSTAWAWLKLNDSTSLVIKTNQVERNETWTFAAWDTFVYPIDTLTPTI